MIKYVNYIMASIIAANYVGRTSEQITNAYLNLPFKGFQYGNWNTGTNVPVSGAANGITLTFTFPTAFDSVPFVMLTYMNNITSLNSIIYYCLQTVTTTQFTIRVFGANTGGSSPMTFNWMAWPIPA